ncbi:hypothetical protein SAMN04488542_103168 [Fontibacillus panacisegetis]|uniref:Thioesterase domain-containing protein n=1 Tax=Fontibacillus panacisegetis TaxID=670482 RepID=A0A1G7GRJ5_9BACL|nr:hypothetical protein [Fontibacillus panacisegetis]SDE90757.1 hypothetical protein SAMN04488542_103168 [Fontibacillus panacisegetis]
MDLEVSENQLWAWKDLTASDFKLHMLPGDHFFIHSQQDMLTRLLSQEISQLLARELGEMTFSYQYIGVP